MTIGEIKAETLMLMGVSQTGNISAVDIVTYENDSAVSVYVYAMNGAINRCMSRFYIAGAIENKPTPITAKTPNYDEISQYGEGIDNVLASMMPLYVVGDVLASDEPATAESKRNEFEQLLSEYVMKRMDGDNGEIEIMHSIDGA